MRCVEHNKVIFAQEITAQLACAKAALEDGEARLTWYYTKECGYWHLTNSVRRGKAGKKLEWVKGMAA